MEHEELHYSWAMTYEEWLGLILVFGGLLITLGLRWYRKCRAAKSADKLLADVLKSKDAFRR
ncbi:MAG: hypothetical protein KGS09_14515 [Nitrospirae bacterium]|nr:hypothetical protein [Nitrospirota bacterium]MDE3042997.1 hypothetical protein [Nitrospirota bacterium]MDE3049315.1 hypothetical protein [Nitrospirota bacterium]MDE3217993.1 hypothetical protein [Nitrospirota bacterium]